MMNETIQLLHSHRSDRSFLDKPISKEVLNQIIQSAYLSPTSINSQQVSLVITQDAAKRKKIADIAGGQPWIEKAPVFITLVLDLYKTEVGISLVGEKQVTPETVEGLISGCTDIGIALGSLIVAARSLGLGIVPIGGIRRDPEAMITLLGLPQHTFPVVGLTLGYVDQQSSQKPRLPLDTFCHYERYNQTHLVENIQEYNQTLMAYWKEIKRNDALPWSENTAQYYQVNYYPKVLPTLHKQGFKLDK